MKKLKKAAILEKQDGGHSKAFSAWHWPLIFLFYYQLAMYQVSCFYHKVHDSSQNCYISAPLLREIGEIPPYTMYILYAAFLFGLVYTNY